MLRGGRSLRLAQRTFRYRGPRRCMCEDASNNESGPRVLYARKLPLTSQEQLDVKDLIQKVGVVEEVQLLNGNGSPSGSAIWLFHSARAADRALKTIQSLRSSGKISIDVRPGALNVDTYEAAVSPRRGTMDLMKDSAEWRWNEIPRSALKSGLAPQMFFFEKIMGHHPEGKEDVNEEIDTAPMWKGSWSIEKLFFGPNAVRDEFGGYTRHDRGFNLPEPDRKTMKEVPLSEEDLLLLPESTFFVGKREIKKYVQKHEEADRGGPEEEEQLQRLNNEVIAEKLSTAIAAMGPKGEQDKDIV